MKNFHFSTVFLTLNAIYERPNANKLKIARDAGLTYSAMCKVTNELSYRNLIKIEINEENKRQQTLRLTKRGHKLLYGMRYFYDGEKVSKL